MFGARIAMLRRGMGMSQQELAKRLGVSASAVGMYEQSRREPPCQIIVTLAELFHVSTDFLLTGCVRTAQDEKTLKELCASFMGGLDGQLVLRSEDGCERPFSEQDLALLLAVILH